MFIFVFMKNWLLRPRIVVVFHSLLEMVIQVLMFGTETVLLVKEFSRARWIVDRMLLRTV